MRETAIDNLSRKGGQPCTLLSAFGRQTAQDARQPSGGPAVAAAPEVAVPELTLAVVPDVRQKFLLRVPEPLPIALDLGQRLVREAHRR
jgi:hypothetical protein